jgi:hypothetical protein
MTEAQAIQRLRIAARQRKRADRQRHEATDDLRRFAREAQKAGVSMSQIAREAGLSRQGLDDLLGDRRPS